jgi:hypothetical protein
MPLQFRLDPGVFQVFDQAEAPFFADGSEWWSDTAAINVKYGKSGATCSAFCCDLKKQHQSLLDNLLWRANRLLKS